MTDQELLRGYDKAGNKAEYMVRIVLRDEISIVQLAERLTRLKRLPGRSLRWAFGTEKPELIPEAALKAYARRREIAIPKTGGSISAYCKGCVWLARDGTRVCDYCLITGHRRGCPAGDGCKKRELRKGSA